MHTIFQICIIVSEHAEKKVKLVVTWPYSTVRVPAKTQKTSTEMSNYKRTAWASESARKQFNQNLITRKNVNNKIRLSSVLHVL